MHSLRRLAGEEYEPDKDEPDQHESGQAVTRELEAAVENRKGAKGVPAQIQAGRGGDRRTAAPLLSVDTSRLASAILGRGLRARRTAAPGSARAARGW